MRKLLRLPVLFAAMVGLVLAAGTTTAPAQDKKKTDDKAKVTAKEEVGIAEVYMAKDGWRFRIKNSEGKSVAIGTVGFDKKEDCLKALDLVKNTLTKSKIVEVKEEKKDEKKK